MNYRIFKKFAKIFSYSTALLTVLSFLILGGAYLTVQYDGNFHEVEFQQVYRSAQLTSSELNARIEKFGIRSILNLRGASPGSDWYENEISIAKSAQVRHLDYRITSSARLTPVQMDEILRILKEAPKPILIHCQAGSDRTGLVAALYLADRGFARGLVADALSVRFGHFPYLFWSKSMAMDDSLSEFLARKEPVSELRQQANSNSP